MKENSGPTAKAPTLPACSDSSRPRNQRARAMLVVLPAVIAFISSVPQLRASCSCSYIVQIQYTCMNDSGTCKRVIYINACRGNNSCIECDPFHNFYFCCAQQIGNAGPAGPCTGLPSAAKGASLPGVTAGELVYVPTCAGGYTPVGLKAGASQSSE